MQCLSQSDTWICDSETATQLDALANASQTIFWWQKDKVLAEADVPIKVLRTVIKIQN